MAAFLFPFLTSFVSLHQRHTRHIFAQATLQGSKLLQEAEAWPDLPLHEAVYGKTEAVRCRQHVNPLKKELQVPLAPPDWSAIYPDTHRPLIVDVGCGSGRFLLAISRRYQRHNLLGLDIRNKLMERANEWAKLLDLHKSVHFMMANATVSLESMLATYPGPLSLVTVQFPDPHFKARHKKRRVVQPQLVRAIARIMPRGGRVFLQSDVEEAVTDMYHTFRQHASAEFDVDLKVECYTKEAIEWQHTNPLGVPTEREIHTLQDGGMVFRTLFQRI
ncbi:hypothetical protein WJX75_008585 [Coccomyxa subellipsoidea]|uniref:tRNA (guanine(46)-N(7))-methyltransferase n=1 Tax=Coccomyxa subellipsoidea TaxID=248742 RepID=A0ABR2YRG9_9CHLO